MNVGDIWILLKQTRIFNYQTTTVLFLVGVFSFIWGTGFDLARLPLIGGSAIIFSMWNFIVTFYLLWRKK